MRLRVIAALLLCAALSGCGHERPPERTVLAFRHARMPAGADPLPALLADFERRHPGVTVVNEPLPWTADVQHQFFVMNLEGGSAGFDVLMLDLIWVPEFARAGWLLDLTERWPAAARAEHFPAMVAAATLDARAWAVPWVTNVGLLYYRRDLLARYGFAPPVTYAELAHQARTILAGERDPELHGFVWQGKQYEGLVVNVLEGLWAADTDVMASDGRIFPDEARARAVLAFRRGLLVSGVSPALVTAADEELTRREFGAGRAVFMRNWPYALELLDSAESPVRGRTGVAALPGGGALGGAHLAVNRSTAHPDAAWALVQHLTRPEAQRAIAGAVGLHPTRPALLAGAPELLAIFHAARPRPVTPWYQVISAALQPEFSAALAGVKSPAQSIAHARVHLDYFLTGER